MISSYLADLTDPRNAILLVIDLQGKIFEMCFNHQRLCATASKALRLADLFGVPVVVSEQYPRGLGPTAPELRRVYDGLGTEKHLIEKNAFGCCGEPRVRDVLEGVTAAARVRRGGAEPERPVDIVVCGIETHVCVQQTTLELLRQGHRPLVLQDGVGARSEELHEVALARFRQCGAVVTSFESVAFEWTRTKDNACFKQMSALVKESS